MERTETEESAAAAAASLREKETSRPRRARAAGALFGTAKDIAFIALMTALLTAGQLALSAVQGVEVVTVLFLAYCYTFGVVRGIAVANCFSLLRCLLFGFFPTAVVLYLVYYNLFAVVFGLLGRRLKKSAELPRLAVLAACAVVMTVLFTMLDNVITPLFFGYSRRAALVYFYNSLPVMCVQTACTAITVCLLFVPLRKAFALIGHRVIRSAR